jgi:ketosteroid isomerase-like protein
MKEDAMRCLVPAILLVMAASPSPAQQCSDAEKTRLQEFDRAWGDATTRGDRAQLQAIFADDYAGVTPNETQNKTTTIDAAVRAAERTRASGQNPLPTVYDNYVITCTPTTAVVTHRNATTTRVNGREQTAYSRSVHVMEKRGGRWQVVGNSGHPLTDSWVLLYMENDWNEAAKKKDVAWFERNFADDATEVSSRTGAVMTTAEAIASVRADNTVYESLDLSEPNVRVDGNTAVVTGVNRLRGRDEQGRPFDRRVRFTDTFIKRDGRWQVWASQATTIP